MVESLAFLEVVGKELGRGQYFFFILGVLALVEIAIHTEQFFGGKAAGFLSQLIGRDFLAVVPPITDGLSMFESHRLCL